MRAGFWTAPLLGVVGGLVLLVAAAAGWVDTVVEREVGGVTVTEPASTPGTAYAPAAVALGLGGIVGGALCAVVRGRARRALGVLTAAIGAAGLVAVGFGLVPAAETAGSMTPAPFAALAGATSVVVAGIAALRGAARPPSASRYRVEGEQPGDDEWSLAAEDEPPV